MSKYYHLYASLINDTGNELETDGPIEVEDVIEWLEKSHEVFINLGDVPLEEANIFAIVGDLDDVDDQEYVIITQSERECVKDRLLEILK